MIPRIKLLPFDYAIRNLGRSPKRLALVCGGSMLVSMLVLGAVAFARGMDSALSSTGLVTNALVVGSGSVDGWKYASANGSEQSDAKRAAGVARQQAHGRVEHVGTHRAPERTSRTAA
jgi:putative ABC transport system permease protein